MEKPGLNGRAFGRFSSCFYYTRLHKDWCTSFRRCAAQPPRMIPQ